MLKLHAILRSAALKRCAREGVALSAISLSVLYLGALSGCGEPVEGGSAELPSAARPQVSPEVTTPSKADGWRGVVGALDEGEVTVDRLSLDEVKGEAIASLSYFDDLFSAPEVHLNGALKADSKRGLVGTLTAQRLSREGVSGVLREDVYQASGAVEPLKFITASSRLTQLLPFKISGGAELKFIRLFESEEAATDAPLFSPHQLPFDLDRALALPEGVVVEVPVKAQVSLNINGQLLSKAWGRSNQLAQLLTASAAGFASGGVQGMLLVEGDLQLIITRLSGAQLRVRVAQHSELKRGLTGNLSVGGALQVKAFSAATVERVKNIKDRLARWGRRPGELLRKTQERLGALSQGLPFLLKGLTALDQAGKLPGWLRGALQTAESIEDPALALIERGAEGVDGAEEWISEEVERRLGAVDAQLNPAFAWLKRHSERAFNLNASLTLSDEDARQLGLMGDYLLDLSTPRGAAAFESILSGRARWEGPLGAAGSGLSLIDLTVADQLAEAGEEGVRRLERATLNGRSQRSRVQVSAPLAQWRFERGRDLRELQVTRGERQERWEAEVWRLDRGLEVGPVREREQLSVGVALPIESSVGAGWRSGALWMSWAKRWPSYEPTPVTQTFSEVLNLTGRLGVSLGVISHFHAEAPGALSSQLTLTLDGALLDALFYEVSPAELWRVFAETAASFDNRFGLPYLNALSRPRLSEEEAASCDEVAYHWGSQYCWLVLEGFIEPLLELRYEQMTELERLQRQRAWLAQLSRSQLLLNPIGARVLTRVLSELAVELGLERAGRIRLTLDHPTHAESSLTERFESELDSESPPVSLEVAEWLGVGEGLTLED